jgi:cation-transporting P-type ATPase E
VSGPVDAGTPATRPAGVRPELDVSGGPALPPTPATGLTDAEAASRRAAGLGNPAPPPTTRTYARIVRENVFTFINNVLFVLGIALVLVGRPMDALVSLGVISTNIVVSVVQEVRAKRTLDRIALLTAPTATVVRDGVERAVPPSELVVGDLVAVGPGDQVVVDGVTAAGRFRADESQLTGESDQIEKIPGVPVFSGSFCVTGSGRYLVETVGAESVAGRITAGARSFRRVLTPLQRQINLVIRLVLLIVVYLEVVLLVNAVVSLMNPGEAVGQATILAGLIPNGLFVSIAIAYALGAVRISRFGALVQQANAIESLSNVDVLCLDKTGTLTTNELTLAETVPVNGTADVTAILGTIVASQSVRNKTSDAIAAACPAAVPVPVTSDVSFSSARKWSAVVVDGSAVVTEAARSPASIPALSGTYALGAPQMLRPSLPDDAWDAVAGPIAERADQGLRVLLLVHGPQGAPIADDDAAVLPTGMRVLAIVVLRDVLRPDAAETLARFRAAGVSPKVISGDDPATVSALARQVGLGGDLALLSGAEVDATDDASLPAVARATDIFGRITPAQKERLVGALRRGGAYVAMIGDGVNDVLSLKRANVAVAMQSGSQATRGVADIVLMNDSFSSLAPAVEEGQRIVNGMQGILALFLTRIATLGALIVSALIIGVFPVALRNASAITFFTVGIPSVMLALWARPGALPREGLARTLVRFVVPAAAVTSLVGLLLLYGTILLRLLEANDPTLTQAEVDAILAAATPAAQSAVTALLVFTGLALVVFIQPPIRSLAVVRRLTPDRRPTYMAIVLAAGFVVTNSVAFLRDIFALQPLREVEWLVVALAFLVWLALIVPAWRFRVVERFLGADRPM